MNELIANLSPGLFWDVDLKKIDEEKHKPYIIQRVLSRGNVLDFKNITSFYKQEELRGEIKKIRSLDVKSANFAAFYFSIPKNEMLYFTKKRFPGKHWNY